MKRVTLKIVNINYGPDPSVTDAEQENPGAPPLFSFEGETEQDLDLTDLVTKHDALSANANAVCHRHIWATNEAVISVNGPVTTMICKGIGQSGHIFTSGSALRDLSPLDFFISVFPMKHLEVIKILTNVKLEEQEHRSVTAGELLGFFGLLIPLTKFNVSNRRDLWKNVIKMHFNSRFRPNHVTKMVLIPLISPMLQWTFREQGFNSDRLTLVTHQWIHEGH